MLASDTILIRRPGIKYPDVPPFHPPQKYPEYPFGDISTENALYDMVRQCWLEAGLDAEHTETPEWNPLGDLVRPGQTVLIKPNLVLNRHPRGGDIQCLITHGSVVRAVLDYVLIALRGAGRIIVGDAPLQGTDFDEAASVLGLLPVVEYLQSKNPVIISLVDFRQVHGIRAENGHIREWREVPGDPAGSVIFDLGTDSMLQPLAGDSGKFRVAKYPARETRQYHNEKSHKYVIAGSVLDADVIISIPKLKTHCKAGVTLGLKNFVGTVCRKQCLAHHRARGTAEGGDEYPGSSFLKRAAVALEDWIDGNPSKTMRALLDILQRIDWRLMKTFKVNPYRDGGWHGNDTVWRMVLDLVRIAMYGRRDGTLADRPQRKILTLLDGIVAGEGEGPLEASPIPAGTLVMGTNPWAVDVLTTAWMGFDWKKIPLLKNGGSVDRWPIADCGAGDLRLVASGKQYAIQEIQNADWRMNFKPPEGWRNHIELQVADFRLQETESNLGDDL